MQGQTHLHMENLQKCVSPRVTHQTTTENRIRHKSDLVNQVSSGVTPSWVKNTKDITRFAQLLLFQ